MVVFADLPVYNYDVMLPVEEGDVLLGDDGAGKPAQYWGHQDCTQGRRRRACLVVRSDGAN